MEKRIEDIVRHSQGWEINRCASFYPNLSIVYGFKPEHLGDSFSKVYKNIYEERKRFPKGTVENQSLKIILNGSYGKLGDEYSFLLDKKPQLEICINGQLLLMMLIEKLMKIPELEVIQANTRQNWCSKTYLTAGNSLHS